MPKQKCLGFSILAIMIVMVTIRTANEATSQRRVRILNIYGSSKQTSKYEWGSVRESFERYYQNTLIYNLDEDYLLHYSARDYIDKYDYEDAEQDVLELFDGYLDDFIAKDVQARIDINDKLDEELAAILTPCIMVDLLQDGTLVFTTRSFPAVDYSCAVSDLLAPDSDAVLSREIGPLVNYEWFSDKAFYIFKSIRDSVDILEVKLKKLKGLLSFEFSLIAKEAVSSTCPPSSFTSTRRYNAWEV